MEFAEYGFSFFWYCSFFSSEKKEQYTFPKLTSQGEKL